MTSLNEWESLLDVKYSGIFVSAKPIFAKFVKVEYKKRSHFTKRNFKPAFGIYIFKVPFFKKKEKQPYRLN